MNRPAPKRASLVEEVSALVTRITGIQLGPRQRVMVENRLRRRMSELKLLDEAAYLRYLAAHPTEETEALVGLLTTHHTFFFREMQHFRFLETGGLKMLVDGMRARGQTTLRVWSAACSRGQEVYSLAMFLAEHLSSYGAGLNFEILGTDVDPESVAIAKNGVYHRREIKSIPLAYLADHWARGTGDIADFVKVKRSLRDRCQFKVLNLLHADAMEREGPFDLIFCRNVFIYFTSEQIAKIAGKLMTRLHETGFLVIGVSETLTGLGLPVRSAGTSVYAREGQVKSVPALPSKPPVSEPAKPSQPAPAPLIRVLCVDDSPSVLRILKQVLQEKEGFKVVGTAENGLDAVSKISILKPDVVTLDIHMPEMSGLEYLKKHWSPAHPPVVMVSSVVREDAALAVECLNSGAADYVEKPALNNLQERGDEIRMKLACAVRRKFRASTPLQFEKTASIQPSQKAHPQALCLVLAGFGEQKTLARTLSDLRQNCQAPIVVLTEGLGGALPALVQQLRTLTTGLEIEAVPPSAFVADGKRILVGDLASHGAQVVKGRAPDHTSILIFGDLTPARIKLIESWPAGQVLLEDLTREGAIHHSVSDVSPATSFAYLSTLFLCRS
ncbi:CheR family methyltransferase [Oligoflexus tunisiensis]|uniref:CheR family methyltransferase n=1 Tax=Oligoflexus tunisiensis TaxID=708132 RepID=UPI000A719CD6|nr:CheR family methyltransferase [Oligoflexus tunisiensis]